MRQIVSVLGLLGLLGAASLSAPGQALSDLLVTGATVTRDSAGQDLAYLRWRAEDPAVMEGRGFAVHGRAGPAEDGAPMSFRAVVRAAGDPATAQAALDLAERLGPPASDLEAALVALGSQLDVGPGARPAERLAALVRARGQAGIQPLLPPLASQYPAVALALGQAWAGPIGAGASTFELRALDGPREVAVVGRVSVVAGAPVPLPAPGRVVVVPDSGPRGNLNLRLRWVTSPELRRRLPLAQGFDVWRLGAAEARAAGWEHRPPTAPELAALGSAGRARRINPGPVVVHRFHDEAGVADFAADPEPYVADDNGRFEPGGVPFEDGSEWAYVVTARDLLGRDGWPSPAVFARVCRTLGPSAPRDLRLEPAASWTRAAGAARSLRLTWRPADPADAGAAAAYFEVYRGLDPGELEAAGAPLPGNFLARVEPPPGQFPGAAVEHLDQTLRPEANFVGRTFWYAVRAVRVGPCGPVAGPLSAPVLGGLPEIVAPEAPGGRLGLNCPRPAVRFLDERRDEAAAEAGRLRYRLVGVRRDAGIDWIEFRVVDLFGSPAHESGRQAFAPSETEVAVEVILGADVARPEMQARVGTVEGGISDWVGRRPAWNGDVWVMRFEAGEFGTLDLAPGDPLAAADLQGPFGLEVEASDPGGWLLLRAPPMPGAEMLVQRSEGAGAEPWVNLGTAVVTDGRLVVDDPGLRAGGEARRSAYRGYLVAGRSGPVDLEPAPCTHLARPASSESIRPVAIHLSLPERAREYRLYRSVDGGAPTLIGQGATPLYPPGLPGALRGLVRHDEVLPESGAELCYFAQVLDEHGNASPMAPLGCVVVRPKSLPAPVLSRPVAVGSAAGPEVRLRWFCPPAGVRQFEIGLVPRAGSNRTDRVMPAKFLSLPVDPPVTRRPDQVEASAPALLWQRDRILTPLVGGDGLGEGPQFEATLPVVEGIEYDIAVTALGRPSGGAQMRSAPSLAHPFRWRRPAAEPTDERVPWPARPLPPVTGFNPGLTLVWLTPTNRVWPTNAASGAVGVVVGTLPPPEGDEVGEFYRLGRTAAGGESALDPNRGLWPEAAGERGLQAGPLLPAVLYRQQVTNRFHARVSGDVIQVSPAIREIQWAELILRDQQIAVLTDPFTAVLRSPAELFVGGIQGRDVRRRLVLMDTHPVVAGARYRYALVRFRADGEIAGTVALGEVEVP